MPALGPRIFGPTGEDTSQADIAKQGVMLQIKKPNITSSGCRLSCLHRSNRRYNGMYFRADLTKRQTAAKRRSIREPLFNRPIVELLQRGDRPVPSRRRDSKGCFRTATSRMERREVIAIGSP